MRGLLLFAVLLGGPAAGALTLDQAIREAATAYQVDARVLTAIAYLESSGGKFVGPKVNKNGTFDVGPMQLNSIHHNTTCKKYNVYTVKGNVYCAAKILKQKYKYKKTDPYFYGRYHSSTEHRKRAYYYKLKKVLNGNKKR